MIFKKNRDLFWQNISSFLIYKEQLSAVTRKDLSWYCSFECKGEKHVERGYRMVDEGRFLLSCGHYSRHIQCLLSEMVYNGHAYYVLQCPIRDTEKFRVTKREGRRGELFFWGQKECHAFVTAFLRNKTLVDAFIDKQKLTQFNLKAETFL